MKIFLAFFLAGVAFSAPRNQGGRQNKKGDGYEIISPANVPFLVNELRQKLINLNSTSGKEELMIAVSDADPEGFNCSSVIVEEENLEYIDEERCYQKPSQLCYMTKSLKFVAKDRKVCRTHFLEKCYITYVPKVDVKPIKTCKEKKIFKCGLSLNQKLNKPKSNCKFEYKTVCSTDYISKNVTENKVECYDNFITVTTKNSQVLHIPQKNCTLIPVVSLKSFPLPSCKQIRMEICAPARDCDWVKTQVCSDVDQSFVANVPSQKCDIQPTEECQIMNELVPTMVEEQQCKNVSYEDCNLQASLPVKVSKNKVIKKCVASDDLSDLTTTSTTEITTVTTTQTMPTPSITSSSPTATEVPTNQASTIAITIEERPELTTLQTNADSTESSASISQSSTEQGPSETTEITLSSTTFSDWDTSSSTTPVSNATTEQGTIATSSTLPSDSPQSTTKLPNLETSSPTTPESLTTTEQGSIAHSSTLQSDSPLTTTDQVSTTEEAAEVTTMQEYDDTTEPITLVFEAITEQGSTDAPQLPQLSTTTLVSFTTTEQGTTAPSSTIQSDSPQTTTNQAPTTEDAAEVTTLQADAETTEPMTTVLEAITEQGSTDAPEFTQLSTEPPNLETSSSTTPESFTTTEQGTIAPSSFLPSDSPQMTTKLPNLETSTPATPVSITTTEQETIAPPSQSATDQVSTTEDATEVTDLQADAETIESVTFIPQAVIEQGPTNAPEITQASSTLSDPIQVELKKMKKIIDTFFKVKWIN